MRVDEVIYSITQATPAITALASDRVTPLKKPLQDVFPAIVYRVTNTHDELNMSGPDGLRIVKFELASMANSYTAVRELADIVRETFHGFRGDVGTASVQGVFILDEDDLYHDDPKRFTIMQEFKMFFCEGA